MDKPQTHAPTVRPSAPIVWLIALLGSIGGTLAALLETSAYAMQRPMGVLLLVVVAPAVEEICKPLALVFLLDKRPRWLRSRAEILVLAGLSGLIFASLENLLYLFWSHPDGGTGFVLWRLTVCTGLHLATSTVFGFGLAAMWRHILARGGHFDIDVCFRYYLAATILHGSYNGLMLILTWTGVLRF